MASTSTVSYSAELPIHSPTTCKRSGIPSKLVQSLLTSIETPPHIAVVTEAERDAVCNVVVTHASPGMGKTLGTIYKHVTNIFEKTGDGKVATSGLSVLLFNEDDKKVMAKKRLNWNCIVLNEDDSIEFSICHVKMAKLDVCRIPFDDSPMKQMTVVVWSA
jgi:hypothetical protein